jgi:hypothetical protein
MHFGNPAPTLLQRKIIPPSRVRASEVIDNSTGVRQDASSTLAREPGVDPYSAREKRTRYGSTGTAILGRPISASDRLLSSLPYSGAT